jgi:alpha-tubulin suppressor-like RCC1 family protein
MTIYVKDSGTWRTVAQPYVKDIGTWRTVNTQYVKDAGTWRTVFTAEQPGALWLWSVNYFGNDFGQLGVNDTAPRSEPVTTFAGGTNWKQFSSGIYFAAAIKTDGTLWTWGYNGYGQLGDNTATDKYTPVTTFAGGTNWKEVSTSRSIAAIKTDGTLWVWGDNYYRQLGTNDTNRRSTPVTTFAGGTNWKSVSCGLYHTMAIKTDGTLWVWGDNGYGQLGTNDTTDKYTPVTTFAGGTNWKQVSANVLHSSAIKTDGTLWSWGCYGYHVFGQLGINDTNDGRLTPVTTFAGGTDWKQVSSGFWNTAAIKTDGTLWAWGRNSYIFGLNIIPTTLDGGSTDWKQVSARGEHQIWAVKTNGELWTWGQWGQYGLASNINWIQIDADFDSRGGIGNT